MRRGAGEQLWILLLIQFSLSTARTTPMFQAFACRAKRGLGWQSRRLLIRSPATRFGPASFPELRLIDQSALSSVAPTTSASTIHRNTTTVQDVIRTRRTAGKFLPPSSTHDDTAYWTSTLDRAIQCGLSAPNHKLTEPLTIRRCIHPSSTISELASIAGQVTQWKLIKERDHDKDAINAWTDDEIEIMSKSKRMKWNAIPAYLIVTMKPSSRVEVDPKQDHPSDSFPFTPLAFDPVTTERELEDYATGAAAVQNILLSLHSENYHDSSMLEGEENRKIAAKWATGPVIRTPAFRKLMRLDPSERVVALIMIGHEETAKHPRKSRRWRRSLEGDILVDMP
jgi:nitroreductase